MFHQHPLTALAGCASTAVGQGSAQTSPPVATELTCSLCQIMRQSQGLSVTGSPPLHVAVSVSRLLAFSPGGYYSYQSMVVLWRAPPVS